MSRPRARPAAANAESLEWRVLEALGDCVWDWDLQSGTERFSPGFLRLYGYRPGEIEESPEALDALTHPEDRAQMDRDRDDHFAGRTPVYRNEHRVRCKDGHWKWILTRGLVIARAPDGRPLRMVGTHTDIDARKRSEAQAWHQASHDALTGLPNRRLFGERLAHELRRARRDGQRLALLALDLDHFKAVNDHCGHDVGDALLADAARRIVGSVREVDMVARLGGDEFVVLLANLGEDAGGVERIARELVERLARPYALLPPGTPQPSVSIGIALFPDDATEPDALYRAADQALYAAKAAGRRGFRFHRARLQATAHTHEQLGAALQRALADGQLRLYVRRVQATTGTALQADALLRWQHPQLGLLRPRHFLSTAEAAGLSEAIDDWLGAAVRAALARWAPLAPGLQLALHPSPGQLQRWSRAPGEGAAPWRALGQVGAGRLLLAVDERQLRDPALQPLWQRPALQTAGLRLLLADFGRGDSALRCLEQPGLSVLRLAGERIQRTGQPRTQAWVRSLTRLGQDFGLQVQASGVRDAAHGQALQALGVDALLGPGVASPMDEAAFGRWLAERSVGNP